MGKHGSYTVIDNLVFSYFCLCVGAARARISNALLCNCFRLIRTEGINFFLFQFICAKAQNQKVHRAGRNSFPGHSFEVPVQCVNGAARGAQVAFGLNDITGHKSSSRLCAQKLNEAEASLY